MSKRKPEPTWRERRIAAHRFDQRMLRFAVRKDGRKKLTDAVVSDMLDRFNGNLRSASIPARIAFARAARRSAAKRLSISPQAPAFMVTLVPRQFALPYSEALLFDWTVLQTWTNEILEGFDYFGIVEISYYTAHPVPNVRERICHFHVHVIVWNTRRLALNAVREKVNREHSALLPGRLCMKIDAYHSVEQVRFKLPYILKPLMAEYRGYPLKGGPKAGWKQKKRDFRSGDAAKALRLLQGVNIEDLCVAGGQGQAFLQTTTQRAKRKLAEREDRQRARLKALIGVGGTESASS